MIRSNYENNAYCGIWRFNLLFKRQKNNYFNLNVIRQMNGWQEMNELRRLREARKMTQEALAEQINATQSAISKWESGKHDPDIEVSARICRFFGIDLNIFFGFKSPIKEGEIPIYQNPRISDFETDQLSVYGSMEYDRSVSPGSAQLLFHEKMQSNQKFMHAASSENNLSIFSFFLESGGMEPHFRTGDMIFVEKDELPKGEGEVVFAESNEPFQIAFASKFDKSVYLHFINERQSIVLNWPQKGDEKIRIIGRVIESRRQHNQK